MVEQRYIQDNDLPFDVADWFIEQIREVDIDCAYDISNQIVDGIDALPERDGFSQRVGGVSNALSVPFFFEIEYLKQKKEKCVMLSVEEIDVDTFLDYIIDKQTLKFNTDEK